MGESVNNYIQANNQQMEVQQPIQQLSQAGQQQQQLAEYQQSPPQLISQVKQFGREGEGMMYHPPAANELMQWPPQQYQQGPYHTANTGGSNSNQNTGKYSITIKEFFLEKSNSMPKSTSSNFSWLIAKSI